MKNKKKMWLMKCISSFMTQRISTVLDIIFIKTAVDDECTDCAT